MYNTNQADRKFYSAENICRLPSILKRFEYFRIIPPG